MSYKINKTDSTLLVDLIDGRIDTESTDLVLVGRNYTGYGEYFNENFVKVLENFANSASPANPLRGQLWYDTSEGRLKVFNGTNWKGTDTTSVSGTQPTMLAGDIWIDSTNNQMYMSDGTEVTLVGPGYTALQGESGWDIVTLVDRTGQDKVVNRLMIGGNPVAIVSKEGFIAATIDSNIALLNGFTTTIEAGFNISSTYSDFEFHGPSASTRSLLDDADDTWTPDDFVKTYPTLVASTPQAINHYTHINSDYGILLGGDADIRIFPTVLGSDKTNIFRNRLEGSNFTIQINSSGSNVDAFYIDTDNERIGLWNTSPQYDLDVTGDLRITGNLQVDGNTTYLDVSTLRVEDKNIELAVPADSSTLSDAELDGAGITIVGTNGSKDIIWKNTAEDNGTWQINAAFDIPAGYTYKIGGTTVLSTTELADTVTSATGLTEIGTLTELNVDNINLNNKSITVGGGAGLVMTFNEATGNINLVNAGSSPVSITGVATPDVSDVGDWVATTEYVDQIVSRQDVYLSLDITGLSNSQIASVIEDMIPAQSKAEGVHAYVHCTQYSGTYAYDASDGLTKSFVAVDKNGTENQSVLLDISFTEQTGQTVSLSVARSLKQFIRNGAGNWVFFRELTSSV